jgi:hypothetical protein
MIATVVVVLFSIIPAIILAEVIARRLRLAKWTRGRPSLDDTQFLASLGAVPASREASLRVRQEIARATRIPADLIAADDQVRELEAVGHPTHFSVLDYFTDLLVKGAKDEYSLVTVRDFVIEFASQMKEP